VAAVGCCLLLLLWFRGCGSSEVEDRLVGKWKLVDGEQAGSTLEFTEGGKVLLKNGNDAAQVGVYSLRSSSLSIGKGDQSERWAAKYEVEFRSPDDVLFVLTDDGLGQDSFAKLSGSWRSSSRSGGTSPQETAQQQRELPRIIGKWRLADGRHMGSTVEFTQGGKVLHTEAYEGRTSGRVDVGMFSVDGASLTVRSSDRSERDAAVYEVEFLNDSEIVLARTKYRLGFGSLGGRWHRIGSAPVVGIRSPALASLEAKREALEQRRAQIGTLVERAEADKQRVVARLRAMGATSAKSIPNTSEARRLVSELQRLSSEIASLQRDALTLDEAIAKAGSLARRMEQSEIAITDDELGGLSVDLRSASDGSPRTTTPIEIETLLDAELSGK
jgi:hypothetical protein